MKQSGGGGPAEQANDTPEEAEHRWRGGGRTAGRNISSSKMRMRMKTDGADQRLKKKKELRPPLSFVFALIFGKKKEEDGGGEGALMRLRRCGRLDVQINERLKWGEMFFLSPSLSFCRK